MLRSDNGPESVPAALADWAGTGTGLCYIPPGQPWRNGYVESFNSRIRDECLDLNSFHSLLHARVVIGEEEARVQPRPATLRAGPPGPGRPRSPVHPHSPRT